MRWTLLTFGFCLFGQVSHGFDPATQDDSQALVRHFAPAVSPLLPLKEGKVNPKQGETISLMGGTDMYRRQVSGDFEASLHLAFPEKNLQVRNIAWPADTVYRQQRPMYFYTEKGDSKEGSVPDQRKRIEPGIFLLQFGKMESLDGRDSLSGFVSAYRELLSELSKISPRIVVVAPEPFLKEGPAGDLAEERNEVLNVYSKAIEELANERGIPFWKSMAEIGADTPEPSEVLVEKIRFKNKLWNQYYRPTNWAFLFGDRQHVPSSRDHRDANRRWFVEELEKLPPLIEEADEAIWKEAKGTGLK